MTELAPFEFEDTVAFVTGAGSGIGRAVAHHLARRGSSVLVTDVDDERAASVAAEIVDAGGAALAQRCDVAQSADFAAARDRCLSDLGGIDIVVNNVGVLVAGRPELIPVHEWQRVLDLNVLGVVRSNEVFLPLLMEQGRGHIVNTGSASGIINYAYDRTPYAASKAAVDHALGGAVHVPPAVRRRRVVPLPGRAWPPTSSSRSASSASSSR